MTNRPLYVRKYHSGRLKEFGYNIESTFDESKELKEIIGLSDSQMLRTIRDVNKKIIDKDKLEILIKTKEFYKFAITKQEKSKTKSNIIKEKLNNIKCNTPFTKRMREKYFNNTIYSEEIKRIQDKINRTSFVKDYIVVSMDNLKQYEYLYENGFYVNGELFKRLSCSAGQARVSEVVFCNTSIIEDVEKKLNNGRNISKAFSPSKFNAYFGLYGSATKLVSDPKFIVIKDFENKDSFMANYVIENGNRVDDTIIQKEILDMPMNRTDGMGLISYEQAKKWAEEIDLDYVPSQFCIRQSFIKGMLCVFPIHEFCETENDNNYIVDTIYKNENGEYIKADLRNYDVIITESQFKLWDSYSSVEDYIQNCQENNLRWGISLHTPKEAKRMMKLNYQFIQTLNLNSNDVEELASQFVDWITGVSYDDIYYTLLFLLGVNNDEKKIRNFLFSSDNYWIKALLINENTKNDKYIRTKIRDLIRTKIERACLGDIYVDGNFQVIVSDPYGFMQHVCGQEVTGLLKKGEFYSNFWNDSGIKKVDGMRSPLTYLSEHVVLDLRNDELVNKWYRYCKLGIILNYHGHESVNFGGSDFDFDILATTSNKTMTKGVYKDELPVVYDAPKPQKIVFEKDDLYNSDRFSFGSIIGSITNKSSNGYALLPVLENKFGSTSQEYRLVKSRLQQCCKAQSAQIDKAKIGKEVKGIPKVWVNYVKLPKDQNKQKKVRRLKRKQLYNSTLLDKYPYFFRYIYRDTNRKYKRYFEEYNTTCKQKFQVGFDELERLQRKTKEQKDFINNFYDHSPVIHSNSSMNLLCKYIESINFDIANHTKMNSGNCVCEMYKDNDIKYMDEYKGIIEILKKFMSRKKFENQAILNNNEDLEEYNDEKIIEFNFDSDDLYDCLFKKCPNPKIITNCLVDYFYKEKPSSNKDLLWSSCGKLIYKNLLKNTKKKAILFPFPTKDNEELDFKYLGYEYTLREVKL